MNLFEQQIVPDGWTDQFRLTRLQTFNWGTFSNIFTYDIPTQGYLFVGPSGSGKSTILDAHGALLTPPKWMDFNFAAREAERGVKDRNVMTYLRGAWAEQTGESGEFIQRFLRTGTTWSAIAETYKNGRNRMVVLVQVFWVRGNSVAPTDARRLYLVLEREFDIRELEFFAKAEFDVRRFKIELPGVVPISEFSAYQERFRRLLGIDNERALRLLHKTQSAKNLGDLNSFLRDFMLDAPETFEIADRLVSEFGELNAAHQAVVTARQQIETLSPARHEFNDWEKAGLERNGLSALLESVDHFRENRRRTLLVDRIATVGVEREAAQQEFERLTRVVQTELDSLTMLRNQKAGMGADVLDRLQAELDAIEAEKPNRMRKRDKAAGACRAMGWDLPDTVNGFVARVEAARQRVLMTSELAAGSEAHKDELKEQRRQAAEEFRSTVEEVKALESQGSNLPARLLALRESMANALGIADGKLPFVGELLEVKEDASAWQGAIERVLGGFARSILVEEKHYGAVSAYLNERNIHGRLAYFRVMPQLAVSRAVSLQSLTRKLNIKTGPLRDWLAEELKAHFDFECAETLQSFRASSRAVTREGQVKHNQARHEKNDSRPVDDRTQWVLGFDNKAKLSLFQERAAELGGKITALDKGLQQLREEDEAHRVQLLHCQTLSDLTWGDIDVAALLTRYAQLEHQIEAEKSARPALAQIDKSIQTQEQRYKHVSDERAAADATAHRSQQTLDELQGKFDKINLLHSYADHPPAFVAQLDERLLETRRTINLDSLDGAVALVERGIQSDASKLDEKRSNLAHSIANRFADFARRWLADSGGLDPVLASAPDYFAKLTRLETDGLPQFEQRFLDLLHEQSDQNLTLLSTKLDQERSAIRARLELVNESLRTAPFGPGTHLVIDISDKLIEDVRTFRTNLRDALAHAFGTDRAAAEERFLALAKLVKRLASQETADKNWRALVLDVRQHVEFVARELGDNDEEIEIYRSGAGKSGGQRQKLAATCLAAALRYQLGGQDRAVPCFSTVALDEAFDKADAEFTAKAMNIFKTFGFQMIIATPMKSVMTLEPFIGGACFVHIKDRKQSAVIPIDYDSETLRLKFTPDMKNDDEADAA